MSLRLPVDLFDAPICGGEVGQDELQIERIQVTEWIDLFA